MKQIITILFFCSIALFACRKNNDVKSTASACLLTQTTETGKSNTGTIDESTYTVTQNYDYNEKGLLTGQSFRANSKNKSNKTAASNSTLTYQYDADGFLAKKVYTASSTDFDSKSSNENRIHDYSYSNGRLVKEIQTNNGNSAGTPFTASATITYEYDGAGNQIKYLSTQIYNGVSQGSYTTLNEYTNNKVSKYTVIPNGGSALNYVIEVNGQGSITKLLNPTDGYENRYQYNNEGTQILREDWQKGKKNSKRAISFDNNTNVLLSIRPSQKGFPKSLFGTDPFSGKNNVIKDQHYDIDGTSGADVLYFTYNYTYQYNSSGLPITKIAKGEKATGEVSSEWTTNYVYSNCK